MSNTPKNIKLTAKQQAIADMRADGLRIYSPERVLNKPRMTFCVGLLGLVAY